MCNVDTIWNSLIENGLFEHLFRTAQMRAVVRTEIIEKLPQVLAEHLHKPVTVHALLESWCAYTKHYLEADVYAKIMAVTPPGVQGRPLSAADQAADLAEGRAAMTASLEALEKVLFYFDLPLRVLSTQEENAHAVLAHVSASGIGWQGMTIGELLEVQPFAVLKMG